ncbi:hypothetical protein EVAR_73344_1 [Eumeta japonica]|uniref:Uncharacterized protein n=1 Tax=Eumeta variegata TaxID=151549 RepID=A0A4C1TCJ5_EUMVA|nr:hypothetical protein EVAR_73344_1 [Eumeta japonica]
MPNIDFLHSFWLIDPCNQIPKRMPCLTDGSRGFFNGLHPNKRIEVAGGDECMNGGINSPSPSNKNSTNILGLIPYWA